MESVTSTATVATSRPARYGKQLVEHLGRRSPGTWGDTGIGHIQFDGGVADLTAVTDALCITITAAAPMVGVLEDVIGRHLARFGARDELIVEWRRSDAA